MENSPKEIDTGKKMKYFIDKTLLVDYDILLSTVLWAKRLLRNF
jgi:hypothetical protein